MVLIIFLIDLDILHRHQQQNIYAMTQPPPPVSPLELLFFAAADWALDPKLPLDTVPVRIAVADWILEAAAKVIFVFSGIVYLLTRGLYSFDCFVFEFCLLLSFVIFIFFVGYLIVGKERRQGGKILNTPGPRVERGARRLYSPRYS